MRGRGREEEGTPGRGREEGGGRKVVTLPLLPTGGRERGGRWWEQVEMGGGEGGGRGEGGNATRGTGGWEGGMEESLAEVKRGLREEDKLELYLKSRTDDLKNKKNMNA